MRLQLVRRYCSPDPSDNPYLRQYLYSIYVHALPDQEVEYPPDSVFHNRIVGRQQQRRSALLTPRLPCPALWCERLQQ